MHLLLSQVSVQLSRTESTETKDNAHLVRKRLAPEEDDALVPDGPPAERQQQRRSRSTVRDVLLSNPDKLLNEVLGRLSGRVDKESHGLLERESDELVDRVAHRGREEHGLPTTGTRQDDLVELVAESSLEHSIGLVDDKNVESVESEGLRVSDVVDQSSGRSDENVGQRLESLSLGVERQTSDEESEPDVHACGERSPDRLALDSQLSRGTEDEDSRSGSLAVPTLLPVQKSLEDGDHEGGGLSGSSLGRSEDISTEQGEGNGASLNRCRGGELEGGDVSKERSREVHRSEGVGSCRGGRGFGSGGEEGVLSVLLGLSLVRRGRGRGDRDGVVVVAVLCTLVLILILLILVLARRDKCLLVVDGEDGGRHRVVLLVGALVVSVRAFVRTPPAALSTSTVFALLFGPLDITEPAIAVLGSSGSGLLVLLLLLEHISSSGDDVVYAEALLLVQNPSNEQPVSVP